MLNNQIPRKLILKYTSPHVETFPLKGRQEEPNTVVSAKQQLLM